MSEFYPSSRRRGSTPWPLRRSRLRLFTHGWEKTLRREVKRNDLLRGTVGQSGTGPGHQALGLRYSHGSLDSAESGQRRDLVFRGRQTHSAVVVSRPQQKKGKRFRKVAGRRAVIRTAIASEPGFFQIDSAQFAPAVAALRCVVVQIECMAELMSQIKRRQQRGITGPVVDLDSAPIGNRHRAVAGARTQEYNLVSELLPRKSDQPQDLFTKPIGVGIRSGASRRRRRCSAGRRRKWKGRGG